MSDGFKLVLGLIVVAVSALGYGLLAARFTGLTDRSKSNLGGDGVIGMAVLTALLMTEHFFVPLQQTVNLVTLLPGVVGFGFLFKRRLLIEVLILAVTIWWAVQFSRTGSEGYDHSLYHLQSAIWNTLDRAIPGIANLHTRFGFNSSLFVLAAGLNIPGMGGWSLSFLGTALIEAMIATDLVLSTRSEKRIVRVYSFIAIIGLLLQPRWLLDPSYLSPEPVIAMGVVYAVLLFLDERTPLLLAIVPFLITVKLSAAPLLLLLDWRSLKKYKTAAAFGMLFLCIWVARNVVLSGHLVFPVAATKLPVEWAERNERTQQTAVSIRSWSRAPNKSLEDTKGLRWIEPWFSRIIGFDQVRGAAWMIIAGISLLVWKRALRRLDWRLLSALALAYLFWFIAAPEPRFATGFMLASGYVLLAYGAESIELFRLDASNEWIIIAFLVAALGVTAPRHGDPEWPKTVRPAVRLALTPSGDTIWTPVRGDQCWAVIPCSPAPQTIDYYPKRALLFAPPR